MSISFTTFKENYKYVKQRTVIIIFYFKHAYKKQFRYLTLLKKIAQFYAKKIAGNEMYKDEVK